MMEVKIISGFRETLITSMASVYKRRRAVDTAEHPLVEAIEKALDRKNTPLRDTQPPYDDVHGTRRAGFL